MNKKNYLSVYAKSFNWAGFFLPKNIYEDCSSLYNFCRYIDNIADDKGDISQKIIELDNFYKKFKTKDFNDKIVKDVWKLITKYNIKLIIIDDLFSGVRSDLKKKVKINSNKDLLIYSYKVAGTVGLMMAKILNVNKKMALLGAIDLGIAMQLTNISRDVIEDFNNNREYINSNFENIKDTLNLADKFYISSFKSIQEIPLSLRFSILVARRVYKKIGSKILSYKNFENYKDSGKIYVNSFGKVVETLLALIDFILLYLVQNNIKNTEYEHNLISEDINLNERI
tara:strand:- start:304 stop:1155 length:852 start_codon:yes stop_codon:yes gene_type:complete